MVTEAGKKSHTKELILALLLVAVVFSIVSTMVFLENINSASREFWASSEEPAAEEPVVSGNVAVTIYRPPPPVQAKASVAVTIIER